jgi:hypothetical protein
MKFRHPNASRVRPNTKAHHLFHLDSVTAAMADRSKIIEENPIGKGLDTFRSLFKSICEGANIACTSSALGQFGREGS